MTISKYLNQDINEAFPVPNYIQACAMAIRADLLHGPSFSLIPEGNIKLFGFDNIYTWRADALTDSGPKDLISETYNGPVGDALRDFIDSLPFISYAYEDFFLGTSEPESVFDEEGYEFSPEYFILERKDLISILFGKLIAKEFN